MPSLPASFTAGAVGREALPKEVIAEHQRARVREATVEVIAKRGYGDTRLDNILDLAKVGVGTFYELFESKDALVQEVYEETFAEARGRIGAAAGAGRAWGDRLHAALAELLEIVAGEPLLARFVLVEVQAASPVVVEAYEAELHHAAEALRSGRKGRRAAKGLPESFEFSLVSGAAWVLQQRIAQGQARSARRQLPQLFRFLAEPYLGEEEVGRILARA
jgi:AcrR family transcriptional regulator